MKKFKEIIKEVFKEVFIVFRSLILYAFFCFTAIPLFVGIIDLFSSKHTTSSSKNEPSSSITSPENSEPDFREVSLPHDFSIIVPKGWKVQPESVNTKIDNFLKENFADNSETLFFAEYFTVNRKYPIASMDIKYNSKGLGITQNDLKYVKSRVKKIIKQLKAKHMDYLYRLNELAEFDYCNIKDTFTQIENIGNYKSIFTYTKFNDPGSPYIQLLYTFPFTNYSIEIKVDIISDEYKILHPIIKEMIHSFKRHSYPPSVKPIKTDSDSFLKQRLEEYLNIINEASH